jgi:hypothetical protein
MWVEHAIFTSLARDGRCGYHLVARSPGITEDESQALATWSPSHGSLVVDAENQTSVNFHRLSGGRFALSRTCEGPAEYSGRGSRQVYTHALVLDEGQLSRTGYQPIALVRDALARGHLRYHREPRPVLAPILLSTCYLVRDAEAWAAQARKLDLAEWQQVRDALAEGRSVSLAHRGNRLALAECILGLLPPPVVPAVSFTTGLRPSPVRPFQLSLASRGG